mgnify:CR=1 FL=1
MFKPFHFKSWALIYAREAGLTDQRVFKYYCKRDECYMYGLIHKDSTGIIKRMMPDAEFLN